MTRDDDVNVARAANSGAFEAVIVSMLRHAGNRQIDARVGVRDAGEHDSRRREGRPSGGERGRCRGCRGNHAIAPEEREVVWARIKRVVNHNVW